VDGREVMENLVVADPYNVTGAYLTQAKLQFDPTGNPMVNFTFNELGGKLFGMLTGDHLPNKSTGFVYSLGIIIDGELFFAPQIRSKISSQAQITGSFTEIEASDLAAVLNAGRLPVRLRQVQEIGVGGPDSSAIGVP
jgi:preprotein translocase subunit SecD